jgi:uncharacterized protein YdaU (DUF1376 family)
VRHFAHHIGDYAAATAHLSFVEDAAYHRLLRRYYQDEKPLPTELVATQRLVGARSREEREAVKNVLEEFFTLTERGWVQVRADREIEVYRSKAKDGARGAEARWGTPKEQAARNRSQRLSAARAKATHTKEEWAAVIEVFGARCLKCGTAAADLIGGTICKDHVIGIRNGGDDGVWNLQPMCRPCNTAKGQDGDLRESALPDWRERLTKRLAKCVATTPHSPSSEAKASDADAASVVFGQGLAWLVKSTGKPEAHCRSQLGKWRKAVGDEALIAVLGRGQREAPIDAMAWLEKSVAAHGTQPRKPWEKPPTDGLPPSEPWEQRMRGYKPGGFWKPNDWGKRPEEPGTRVPQEILATWRQQGADA